MLPYKYYKLDPRETGEARAHNSSILGPNALGVEVNIQELADQCGRGNIDPQHLGGNSELAAIEACVTANLPPDSTDLVTLRPDLDSVGGMAVLTIRMQGIPLSLDVLKRIGIIAEADKFKRGVWPGPRPLPTESWGGMEKLSSASVNDLHLPLAAVGASTADASLSVEQRVLFLVDWILTGKEPEGYRQRFEEERRRIAQALSKDEIAIKLVAGGKVAVVISPYRTNTQLGYCLAPVVVAHNPKQRFDGGAPHPHTLVCQYAEGYLDLGAVQEELLFREAGWVGSKTIISSPQGVATTVPVAEVVELVKKHLKI